jgi:hypothetical protein
MTFFHVFLSPSLVWASQLTLRDLGYEQKDTKKGQEPLNICG